MPAPAGWRKGFRGAAVRYQWELGQFEAGPVLRLYLELLDDPRQPYGLETLLDMNKKGDLALTERLAGQDHLNKGGTNEQVFSPR